jgi:CDP-glucose 4,6-dehydratase
MFKGQYKGKRVLVTGHTGFKGSWLCAWLLQMGAEVCGFSIGIPTSPANFEVLGLKSKIKHIKGDVRDYDKLLQTMLRFKPEIVFHLAAQSLVRLSYSDPMTTFATNVMGTMNVLECVRQCQSVRAGVMITSDKCYRNVEWTWGYRENDKLGGEDPYSASKGCAELIIYSYMNSFFKDGPMIASGRAGNVIGGGDWAADRIVPDAVRAWSEGKPVIIRNPDATRPWQHVLEPLSGYLLLGERLLEGDYAASGEAFNFGPASAVNQSVGQLLSSMAMFWHGAGWKVKKSDSKDKKEAVLLKLCCDKALNLLGWSAILSFEKTASMTVDWYRKFYNEKNKVSMLDVTIRQIEDYCAAARDKRLAWAIRQ